MPVKASAHGQSSTVPLLLEAGKFAGDISLQQRPSFVNIELIASFAITTGLLFVSGCTLSCLMFVKASTYCQSNSMPPLLGKIYRLTATTTRLQCLFRLFCSA